jgi:hypothetical protein
MIVRIDVGPFEDEAGLRQVIDVLLAVFEVVPKEPFTPVTTTIVVEGDSLDG